MYSGMAIMAGINGVGWGEGLMLFLFGPLLAWSLAWRAIALWKAARRNHLAWFVILSVIATVGILDIIYIFAVAKGRDDRSAAMVTETTGAG